MLSNRTYAWSLIALIALSVLARLAVVAQGSGVLDDPDNYLPLARAVAEGKGLSFQGRPTAYRPPLYPIMLAPLVAVLGARVGWGVVGLHLVLGMATVAITGATARRWGLAPGLALIGAGIVAFDPVLVAQARSVMTETPAALLVAATLWALTVPGTRGAVLGGIGFGLAVLCRPSLLPGAGLTAVAAVVAGPGGMVERCRRGAFLALVTAGVLTPWAVRNARVLGEPVWTTTHGGYTLALANNPVYYDDVLNGPPGAVWSGPNQARWSAAVNRALAGLSEPEADRRCRALGLRMLTERPLDFARATLAREGRFWGLAPAEAVYSRPLRLVTAGWTLPLWIALILGFCRRTLWRWPRVAAPMVIIALSAVHLIFWTDLRMRAPLVPALALAAATAGETLSAGRGSKLVQQGLAWVWRKTKKNPKSRRILLFKFPRDVRLMSAALGGFPIVSRFGR